MRAETGPGGRVGRTAWVAVAAIGKAGMCSSRCQGVTIRSQAPPVLWSAMRCPFFFAMGELLALGEQVEQPLQLGGAYLQVRGELRPGLFPAAVQRVQQPAVVVCGAAEFTAGALGQRQGEALLLLELSIKAAQPGAAG